MGFREWGFLIKSEQDTIEVLELIDKHNKLEIGDPSRGEDLSFSCIIQNKESNDYYLCVGNRGGGIFTSNFIKSNYVKPVYYPFEKPKWWSDESQYTYVWNNIAS